MQTPKFQLVAHFSVETNKALSTAFKRAAFRCNNNTHFTAVHICTHIQNVGVVYVEELVLF